MRSYDKKRLLDADDLDPKERRILVQMGFGQFTIVQITYKSAET